MTRIRAYQGWRWRRLGLLFPSMGASLAVPLWLALEASVPASVRIPCFTVATALSGLMGFLVSQTIAASRLHSSEFHQQIRALRRQARSFPVFALLSLLLGAGLLELPSLFEERAAAPVAAALPRRRVPRAEPEPFLALREPGFEEPDYYGKLLPDPLPEEPPGSRPIARMEPPAPKGAELPVPVPLESLTQAPSVPRSEAPPETPRKSPPEILPIVGLEPTHLQIAERDLALPQDTGLPAFGATDPGNDGRSSRDENPFAFHPDLDQLKSWGLSDFHLFGLYSRPLPDESDPDSLRPPEGRLEGLLLVGKDTRAPGLTLAVAFPISRNDSIDVSWMGARMPLAEQGDRRETPNWDHFTLAYTHRFVGYTQHATFDLSASIGANADFFGAIEGIPNPQGPKFTPYIGADLGFWQQNAVGLLLHIGESLPVTTFGSALGVTDLSAVLRVDISERISLHGGYRVLMLRYKVDDLPSGPQAALLNEPLTGPVLGLDVRF